MRARRGGSTVLTPKEVREIAAYARIALADEELDEMVSYMNKAIDLLQSIRAYDLEGVPPTSHPIGGLSNVMRADEPNAHGRALSLEAALANAASSRERMFRVPSILGGVEGDRR